MSLTKKILIAIAVVIAIFLIIAAFLPKGYAVQREVTINKPKAEVFEYIKYIKNQDNYSKWNMMDPAMKKTYTGTDGEVGFISAWVSENDSVGTGEQEIKSITEGERIDLELRFKVPFEATEQAYMSTTAISETETKVVWGFNGHIPYPMNIMLLTMNFDEMIGGDLQTGLNNLKTVLEK